MNTATLPSPKVKLPSPHNVLARAEEQRRFNAHLQETQRRKQQEAQIPNLVERLLQACAKVIANPSAGDITGLQAENYMTISPYQRTVKRVLELPPDLHQQLFRQLDIRLQESGWCIVETHLEWGQRILFTKERRWFLIGMASVRVIGMEWLVENSRFLVYKTQYDPKQVNYLLKTTFAARCYNQYDDTRIYPISSELDWEASTGIIFDKQLLLCQYVNGSNGQKAYYLYNITQPKRCFNQPMA
jgi:hypothetical protein